MRHVAQVGAAIGREFSYTLLRIVSRLPVDELGVALDRLVASELVFSEAARQMRSTLSSMRWCRTRPTAARRAAPGAIARADRRKR